MLFYHKQSYRTLHLETYLLELAHLQNMIWNKKETLIY